MLMARTREDDHRLNTIIIIIDITEISTEEKKAESFKCPLVNINILFTMLSRDRQRDIVIILLQ